MKRPGASVVQAYLQELEERLVAILGADLVGVYLHGSVSMGAFVSSRSDFDVLAVSDGPLLASTKAEVADALSEGSLPCPGVTLELSIVTIESARSLSDAPMFELHLNTHWNTVVDGTDHAGDADLVAHFAMAIDRGISLFGPDPEDVFAPVDRHRFLRSLIHDLTWALDRAPDEGIGSYAVLNACRGVRFARTGELSSKLEGAHWALGVGLGDPDMITVALRHQEGADQQVDSVAATSFVREARNELLREASLG